MNKNSFSIGNAVAAVENHLTMGHEEFIINIDNIGPVFFITEYDPNCVFPTLVNIMSDDEISSNLVISIMNPVMDSTITHYKCIHAVYSALFAHIRRETLIKEGESCPIEDFECIDEDLLDIAIVNHRIHFENNPDLSTEKLIDAYCNSYFKIFSKFRKSRERLEFVIHSMMTSRCLTALTEIKELQSQSGKIEKYSNEAEYHLILEWLKKKCVEED